MPEAPTLTSEQPATIVLDKSDQNSDQAFALSLEKSLGEAIEKDRGRTVPPPKTDAPAPPKTEPAAHGATPKPADDPVDHPDWRPKGGDDWRTVKAKHTESLRNYETRLAAEQSARQALEKRLAEIPDPNLFEKTKTERDQLSQQLKAVAFAKHPEVIANFKKRENDAVAMARMAVSPDLADKVMELVAGSNPVDNPELADIMQSLTPLRAGRLQRAIEEMDLISLDRQRAEIEGAKHYETWQQQQTETARKQLDERKTKMRSEFDNVLKEWSDPNKGIPIYQPREGDQEWNTKVQTHVAEAQKYLTEGLPDAEVVKAALFYAGRDAIIGQLQAQATALEQMREELKSYQAAQPGVHRPSGTSDGAARDGDPEKALERLLNQPGVFQMRI